MKKLVIMLLMSCVVGSVSAATPGKTPTGRELAKEAAFAALTAAGTRILPAVAGYAAATAVKETGSYGFMAFLGLALVPFALDTKKVACYNNVPAKVKTGLNSFAAGVVAREAVSLLPVAKARLLNR